MSSYSEQVEVVIAQMPCNTIFVANELKKTQLEDIPEKTYYKILERMVKQKMVQHLTKGLYFKPERDEDGIIPVTEAQIVEYYVNDQSGIVIGEKLFQEEGLVEKKVEKIEVLSRKLQEDKKHIGNIGVYKVDFLLNSQTKPVVRTLEILQNYNKVENLNKNRFLLYMKRFSEIYTEEVVEYVIEHRKYKKSTIAFLERMLTWYGISNSLNKYLSPLSEYKIPSIAELRSEVPLKIKSYLDAYVVDVRKIYKENLHKVILYGSYARGDYNVDSDIDIMILVDASDDELVKYRHELSALTYDYNMSYTIDINPIVKSNATFQMWVNEYPFYSNVAREGVELYGVA